MAERENASELMAIVHNHLQLEPVKSRRLHHWIAPNKERLVGRQRELARICDLLKKELEVFSSADRQVLESQAWRVRRRFDYALLGQSSSFWICRLNFLTPLVSVK